MLTCTQVLFSSQIEMNVTSPEAAHQPLASAVALPTSQTQSTVLSSEPAISPSLEIASAYQGIAPPTYLQAIQQDPIPSENQNPLPSEPPPEYTGPSPGYDSGKTGNTRFIGESTMSTAEEQERTNAMEEELRRLIILLVNLRKYFSSEFLLVILPVGTKGRTAVIL